MEFPRGGDKTAVIEPPRGGQQERSEETHPTRLVTPEGSADIPERRGEGDGGDNNIPYLGSCGGPTYEKSNLNRKTKIL